MDDHILHLANCGTCQRIIGEIEKHADHFTYQNIKQEGISEEQIDFLKDKVGTYEALFSKRARKFQGSDLKNQTLTEDDYRRLILEEYTFLKRPVVVYNGEVFVGSAKSTTAKLIDKLQSA